jgi:hypothetical protein
MIINRLKQFKLYFKAIKAGTIKEVVHEGQKIWSISHDAPDDVKALGPELRNMELELYAFTTILKVICTASAIVFFFKIYGIF